MKRFRGGLACKAHRLLYLSTLGSRVIKNIRSSGFTVTVVCTSSMLCGFTQSTLCDRKRAKCFTSEDGGLLSGLGRSPSARRERSPSPAPPHLCLLPRRHRGGPTCSTRTSLRFSEGCLSYHQPWHKSQMSHRNSDSERHHRSRAQQRMRHLQPPQDTRNHSG